MSLKPLGWEVGRNGENAAILTTGVIKVTLLMRLIQSFQSCIANYCI